MAGSGTPLLAQVSVTAPDFQGSDGQTSPATPPGSSYRLLFGISSPRSCPGLAVPSSSTWTVVTDSLVKVTVQSLTGFWNETWHLKSSSAWYRSPVASHSVWSFGQVHTWCMISTATSATHWVSEGACRLSRTPPLTPTTSSPFFSIAPSFLSLSAAWVDWANIQGSGPQIVALVGAEKLVGLMSGFQVIDP